MGRNFNWPCRRTDTPVGASVSTGSDGLASHRRFASSTIADATSGLREARFIGAPTAANINLTPRRPVRGLLQVAAGADAERPCAGPENKLPFGNIPRLLLAWVCTEAVRTQSREIVMGKSLYEFMRKLEMEDRSGSPRGDRTRLRNQMKRLFRCTVSLIYEDERGDASVSSQEIRQDVAAYFLAMRISRDFHVGFWFCGVLLKSFDFVKQGFELFFSVHSDPFESSLTEQGEGCTSLDA